MSRNHDGRRRIRHLGRVAFQSRSIAGAGGGGAEAAADVSAFPAASIRFRGLKHSAEAMTPSDTELLTRLREGGQDAFATLLDRYHTRLTRFARALTPRAELAEDIVNATWLELLQSLDHFETSASLNAHLFRICAARGRVAARHDGPLRAEPNDPSGHSVDPARFGSGGMWSHPPLRWPSTAAGAPGAELAERVDEAITRLPRSQRQIVTLCDVEGLAASDVCSILDLPESDLRVLLCQGRAGIWTYLAGPVSTG